MGLFDKLFKKQKAAPVREEIVPKVTQEKARREKTAPMSAPATSVRTKEATPENVPDGKATGEGADGMTLLDRYEKGLIDDTEFLKAFGNARVFYSTPFGDHKDGGSRLFILPARGETGYYPVFASEERLIEFYEEAGRLGYLIIESTFNAFLETVKKINDGESPVKMGAVIEPGYNGMTIEAAALDAVIGMTK